MMQFKVVLLLFSMEDWFALSMHPEASILHDDYEQSLYTLMHACTKQLWMWPCSLTKNIG